MSVVLSFSSLSGGVLPKHVRTTFTTPETTVTANGAASGCSGRPLTTFFPGERSKVPPDKMEYKLSRLPHINVSYIEEAQKDQVEATHSQFS